VSPQGEINGLWFDEVHGVGWRMITISSESEDIDPDLDAWFTSIGGAFIRVAGTSGDLINWFETHDVCWALQRPDFHLFGTATNYKGATALLTELRHQLQPIPSDEYRRPQ
jgi:hypothetical protein